MKKVNILIVEDEPIVAQELSAILGKLGFDIAGIAATGEEAISIAATIKPDLILMDIVLAGEMDGVTTAERIRKQFGIPVVYLTGYSDENTLRRARVTEPFGYILKPFETKELKSAIEVALYKSRIEALRDDLNRMIMIDLENPLQEIVAAAKDQAIAFKAKIMANYIANFIKIKKLEEGKLPLNKTSFDGEIIAEKLAWLKDFSKFGGTILEIKPEANLIIVADLELVRPALEVLLINAINRVKKGGKVSLIIKKAAAAARAGKPPILFEVIDDGAEIPVAYLPRIFEELFIIENQQLKTLIGGGLGLVFCKLAVEAHGGTISAESSPGKGSRFYFNLPADY